MVKRFSWFTGLKCVLLLGLVSVMCPQRVWGQKVAGTISGTVVDSSSALIPAATVVVTNANTGATIFRTVTDSSGRYTVPAVQPGAYMMTVSHAGFKTEVRQGVVIDVNQDAVIDFTLTVGSVTQEVSVTAAAPLMVTESATISSVVGPKQVVDLPLNGRYFVNLITLSTGVTPYSGVGNPSNDAYLGIRGGAVGVQANGMRPNYNNYTVNGIDDEESTVANIVLFPPIDVIQEFNIQTTNQGAQFGKSPGATINVATKGGTNKFHGDAYEFLRNSRLDAANFYDRPGLKPPFHLNQYGATLGGPIKKNKTFFFAYWDADKTSQGQTYTTTVPTAAERNGDFSSLLPGTPIYDPTTLNSTTNLKQAFTNNIIPTASLSAPALALTALQESLPNRTGFVNNFVWNPLRTQNGASLGGRIDHQIRTIDSFYANFMYQNFTLGDPSQVSLPILPDSSAGISSEIFSVPELMHVRGLQIGETHTFSPTLVADTHFGFSREYEIIPNALYKTVGLATAIGIPGVNPPSNSAPYTQGLPSFSITGYTGLGEPSTPPFIVGDNNFEGIESMTWVKGKHTLEFGGDLIRRQYNYFQSPTQRGAFTFTGNYTSQLGVSGTGNGFADFLLGIPLTTTSAVFSNVVGQRQWESGLYFQDTYKVTPKLTLTLGLRYEMLQPRTEAFNRQGDFDTQIPGGAVVLAGTPSAPCGRALRCMDWGDVAPRFSFAYQLNNKTVVRGGYGIFYGDYAVNGFGGFTTGLMLVPPFYRGSAITNSVTTPTNTLSSGVLPAIVPQSSIPVVNGYVYPVNGAGFKTLAQNPYGKNVYIEEYNFTFERQLSQNNLVSLSYVGNQSHRSMYTTDVNQAYPGPGAVASRRPFPAWPDINYMMMDGQGNYNSLQLQVRQREWKGLSYTASYTYSKSIDDATGEAGGVQDYYNLQQSRGASPWDQKHVFTLDGTYMLPFGPGRAFASGLTGVPAKLAEGWQINGIYSAMGGLPFTPGSSVDNSNTTRGEWANRICNGTLSNPTPTHWFNTSCFLEPTIYTWGNGGRNILSGPGVNELDFSLFKNTYISEDRERYLQFRAETFNIFNRPQFNNPGTSIGSASAGVISAAGDPAGFVRTSRQIQFSLKLYF